MSRISSGLPIFALSRNESTLNLCALYRGVTPVAFDNNDASTSAKAQAAVQLLKDKGFLMSGDLVLLTHGDERGSSNTCRTLVVD